MDGWMDGLHANVSSFVGFLVSLFMYSLCVPHVFRLGCFDISGAGRRLHECLP